MQHAHDRMRKDVGRNSVLERRTPIGTPKFRYENNIKKDLKRRYKFVRCIYVQNLLYSLVGRDAA
jgi:hypothetical protein